VRIKDAEQKKNQSIETAENERERKICVYVKKWYKRDDIVSPAMRLENPSFLRTEENF
jgi:hypothetical protein